MSISVSCQCGKQYQLKDEMAGKRVRCKACNATIEVPEPDFTLEGEPAAGLESLMQGEPAQPISPTPGAPASMIAPAAPEIPYPGPNHSSYASNPALLKLDLRAYARHQLMMIIGFFAILSLGIPLIIRGYEIFALIPLAAAIFWLGSDLLKERGKLAYGCVNPAIIVADKPWRVATFTDLSTGGPTRPAIRVDAVSLRGMTGGPPEVGKTLAVVALYQPGTETDAWHDIYPTIIQLATTKPEQVQRIMSSIPAREWDALANGLARIDATKPGLYKLWKGNQNQTKITFTPAAEWGLMALIWAGLMVGASVVRYEPKSSQAGNTAQEPAPVAPAAPQQAPPTHPPTHPTTVPADPVPLPPAPPTRPKAPTSAPAIPPVVSKPPRATPAFPPRVEKPPRAAPPKPPRDVPAVEKDDSLEKVEIEWGGKWWKGRIIRREGEKALVHYDGWNSSFDEWVTPNRLRPLPAQ